MVMRLEGWDVVVRGKVLMLYLGKDKGETQNNTKH
jgi:hypothetical protein